MKINHLSPIRCMMCRFEPAYEEFPLCPKCVSRMFELLTERCKTCNKTATDCTCGNREGLKFLFFYGSRYSKRIIYHIKHDMDVAVMDFLVDLAVDACEIKVDSFDAIAFVPRVRRNLLRSGYDQAEEIAKAFSRAYGVPIIYALEHSGRREQKLLSRKERFENIKKSYRIAKAFENNKKFGKILLVDDVTTTGATMKACAEILRENTARQVVRFAFAKTNYFDRKASQV